MAPKRRRAATGRRPPSPPPAPRSPSLRRPARPALRFLVVFLGLASGLFLLYRLSEVTHAFRAVNELNAGLSGVVLSAAGVANTRMGTTLQFESGGFDVISECSGVYVAILFAAAVLAFPAPWRARALGLAAGLLLLFGINILRLASLGVILQHRPAWMPLFHEYLWQVLFILIVAAIYVAWLERIVLRARTHPAA